MRIEDEIKQKEFKSAYQKLTVNLLFTTNWLSASHSRILKPYGISIQQYNILRILRGQHPNHIIMGAILERMLDKSSNVTRLVDKLEAKLLVTRTTCSDDKRKFEVKITDEGLLILKKLDKITSDFTNYLEQITEEEALKMSDLLDKMRDIKF